MFYAFSSNSATVALVRRIVLKKFQGSQLNHVGSLQEANFESRYLIIDDNEFSHTECITNIPADKLSKVLLIVNAFSEKAIINLAHLGCKLIVSYQSLENDLSQALNCLIKNQSYFSEDIKVFLINSLVNNNLPQPHLTKKEKEIILLLGQGLSTKEVGAYLNISHLTVNVHHANIKGKLNIPNNSHFIKYCVDLSSH